MTADWGTADRLVLAVAVDDAADGDPAELEHGHNLRGNWERSYRHQLDHQKDDLAHDQNYDQRFQLLQTAVDTFEQELKNMRRYVFGHIMTQMTAKAGIAKHGEVAVNAL